MGTNFQFLSAEWGTFYERATKAEQLVITDPRASLAYLQKTVIVYHPRRIKVNHLKTHCSLSYISRLLLCSL